MLMFIKPTVLFINRIQYIPPVEPAVFCAESDRVVLSCVQMEKALVSLALKTEEKAAESKGSTSPQKTTVPQTPDPSAQVPTALKGVSQSLLDRVGRPGGLLFILVSFQVVCW